MKKLILVFIFGSLFTGVSFAQAGIKAGINLATMAEEHQNISRSDIENKSITGAVVGLTFGIPVADILTIQPEVLFSQSGGSNTYNVLGSVTKTTYKINYLEVPVLAKLTFGNAHRDGFGVHIAAGPWIGYALSGNYNSKTTADDTILLETDRKYTFDNQDDTQRLNYGMIGAAGISYKHLVFDLRYNYGLNNLLDNDANNTNDNKPVLQTRGIALTAGFTF